MRERVFSRQKCVLSCPYFIHSFLSLSLFFYTGTFPFLKKEKVACDGRNIKHASLSLEVLYTPTVRSPPVNITLAGNSPPLLLPLSDSQDFFFFFEGQTMRTRIFISLASPFIDWRATRTLRFRRALWYSAWGHSSTSTPHPFYLLQVNLAAKVGIICMSESTCV